MSDVTEARDRLLRQIKEKAVVHGRVVLSSGAESDYYIDVRRVTLDGEAAPLVGQVMLDLTADLDYEAVGGLTLVPGHDIERVSVEIGYWLGRALWGRGIVTDAVRAATGHAFAALDARRVFAVPFADNVASHRVLEKAGYVREGTMRRSAIKDGVLHDQQLYAAYDDRWPA